MHLQEGASATSWSMFSIYWVSIDLIVMIYILVSIKSDRHFRRMLPIFAGITGMLLAYEIYAKLLQVLAHRQPLFYNDFFLINDALYLYADLFSTWWPILLLVTGIFLYLLFRVVPAIWSVLGHSLKHASTSISPVFLGLIVLSGMISLHQFHHTRLEDAPAQLISGRIRHNIESSASLYSQVHDSQYRKELNSRLTRIFGEVQFRPDIYLFVIESYGKILAERSSFAGNYQNLMTEVNNDLQKNGWNAVSTYSHSPVSGSGSWLSTASFLSGIHIDNQAMYHFVTSKGDLPYVRFFQESNYRTVSLEPPSRSRPGLPLTNPYGFDTLITFRDLEYKGEPVFGWGIIPDQYSLYMAETYWLNEITRPLFLYFPMVSSHAPWTDESIPPFIENPTDKSSLVTAYRNSSLRSTTESNQAVTSNQGHQFNYFRAITYEFDVITNFLSHQNPEESIAVILGDHQPPLITGNRENFQTPVHIISAHESVLKYFSSHGYSPGMYKNPPARDTVYHHQIMRQLSEALFMLNDSLSLQ